jgi:cytochrome c
MKIDHSLRLLAAAMMAVTFEAAQAQDATAGKADFTQCAACHSADGSNGVGPSLKGIDGRAAGSFPGFHYSRGMKGAGLVWDAKSLDAFIADPQKVVPGNVMPFSGVADPKQRADLIAFLKTLK